MFNAQELLGVLMQGTLTGASPRRVEHALHTQGPGQPGGSLAQLLGGSGQSGKPRSRRGVSWQAWSSWPRGSSAG
jgi:hypothetical protein